MHVISAVTLKSRIYGIIYGQLIGDALGGRYEFSDRDIIINNVKEDIDNEGILPILGGGPHRLHQGQVTDDSELALGLLYTIIANGKYDIDSVVKKYIKWYRSEPFDVGITTRRAFRRANNHQDVIDNSCMQNKNSLSNGCLMRISPLGAFGYSISEKRLLEYAKLDCELTNPNPVAIDATGVYVVAIKSLLENGSKFMAYEKALKTAKTKTIRQCLKDADITPDKIRLSDSDQTVSVASQFMGYLCIALQNTFYELLHGEDFYESICNIVLRGGDTDTNACIAGALLGAYYGIDDIPSKWKIVVSRCNNPRIGSYPEVDQTNINSLCELLFQMIKKDGDL